MADRLAQLNAHLTSLSIVQGDTQQPLLEVTVHEHLRQIAKSYPDRLAIASGEQQKCLTFAELDHESDVLARALHERGVTRGDRVAIIAGNCWEYVVLFYATAKVGAMLAVLNPQYTPDETSLIIKGIDVKLLFIAHSAGGKSLSAIMSRLQAELTCAIILLSPETDSAVHDTFLALTKQGRQSTFDLSTLSVECNDVVNIQYTSGTTSLPKPSCLTHRNVLNNGRFVGDRMNLTEQDVLCLPVPLFHTFGLVLGTLAAFTHGAAAVYPSEMFNAKATLEAVQQYQCTALHGVPTIFIALLELLDTQHYDTSSLRTGIAAGTVVNASLMARIQAKMNIRNLTIAYGQTETSPCSTMSSSLDPMVKRTTTVGNCMPWTTIKVVDEAGQLVPRGTPGEVLVGGYLLHKGYWNNRKATEECLVTDEQGRVFIKSGDLGVLDAEGYLSIPGRIKDTIIRGGENISPSEIENHLAAHPAISDVSVVAVADERYGDVVGAFVKVLAGKAVPTLEDVQVFARERMARYKVPAHVFIMGEEGLADDFPKTGSGKVRKVELRKLADTLVTRRKGM